MIAFLKLIPRKFLTEMAYDGDREIVALDPEQIPLDIRAELEPRALELRALGFRDVLWSGDWGERQFQGLFVALLHDTGKVVGVVSWAAGHGRAVTDVTLASSEAERFLVTGNSRKRFDAPPEVDEARPPVNSVEELVEVHMKRISDVSVRSLTDADVESLLRELRRVKTQYLKRRGLYVPV